MNNSENKSAAHETLVLMLKLGIICIIVSGLLAVVNKITSPIISSMQYFVLFFGFVDARRAYTSACMYWYIRIFSAFYRSRKKSVGVHFFVV